MSKHIKITLGELLKAMKDGTITQGPIRHPQLPPALLKEIQRLWRSVGKAYYGSNGTMEQWEIQFMRDTNPDEEVLAWQRIERATKWYLAEHPKAAVSDAVAGICFCSMGALDPEYKSYWDRAVSGIAEDGQHRHGTDLT